MKTENNPLLGFCMTTAIFLLFFCVSIPAKGQKIKTYKIWVTLMDESKVNGILQAVNEKQLMIVDKDLKRINLDSKEIDVIKLRRAGSMGRGAWIGAASGIVAGVLVGAASHDENDLVFKEASMGKGGVLGLFIGTGVGIGIGSAKKKVVISGDENAYRSHLPVLRKYAPQTSTEETIEGKRNSEKMK